MQWIRSAAATTSREFLPLLSHEHLAATTLTWLTLLLRRLLLQVKVQSEDPEDPVGKSKCTLEHVDPNFKNYLVLNYMHCFVLQIIVWVVITYLLIIPCLELLLIILDYLSPRLYESQTWGIGSG